MGKITHVKGNAVAALINKEVTTLLHVTNTKGTMNSGVAKEIKDRVPQAFLSYSDGGTSLGSVTFGESGDNQGEFGVFNMTAQEGASVNEDGSSDGKRYLNYAALAACLEEVRTSCTGVDSFAIPYMIGSDRAGGDWSIVKELVEWYLGEFDITYYELT